jgi:hypothetical protein
MFNTSFSKKNTIKNKKIFFYFAGSDPVQCIFGFEPDTVRPEQWRMSPLFTWIVEHGSTVYGFSPHKKQQRAASCKLVAQPQLMVGPTSKKLLLLQYKTTIFVAPGEPHPQPQYQTAPKSLKNKLYLHNLIY